LFGEGERETVLGQLLPGSERTQQSTRQQSYGPVHKGQVTKHGEPVFGILMQFMELRKIIRSNWKRPTRWCTSSAIA